MTAHAIAPLIAAHLLTTHTHAPPPPPPRHENFIDAPLRDCANNTAAMWGAYPVASGIATRIHQDAGECPRVYVRKENHDTKK